MVEYYSNAWDEAITELDDKLQNLLQTRLQNRYQRMEEIISIKLHGASDQPQLQEELEQDIEQVMLELNKMKVRRQVEESQLRFNLFVLQQQFKETTSMLSEGRRSLNAMRPILLKYKSKASF